MPTFIITANYTSDAIKGLMGGAKNRRGVIAGLVEAAGGSLKDMYITTGANDVMAIVDLPDGADALAVNMAIGASGAAANFHTTRAWSPEELEDVAQKAAGIAAAYKHPAD
ncbi:MAG: GYD domain-containing protein [Pseudomonadota bacterium]